MLKVILGLLICVNLSAQQWLEITAQSGDTRILLLKKYKLTDQCSKDQFLNLNNIKDADFLIKGKKYKMPIQVYTYNGQSIRSTIKITDYNQAKAIQKWNNQIVRSGVKTKQYQEGGKLWVPYFLKSCYSPILSANNSSQLPVAKKEVSYDIFGDKYKNITIENNSLKNRVYYLVSGHGGPDPGAIGKCQGTSICEDEYAYDITLRLGRKLIAKGAIVYIITRDNNDGIRDISLLKCDHDEVTYPNLKMPINPVKRLNQRVNAINQLYYKHKKQGLKQRMIVIHIDSRGEGSRVDMFFYHYKKSKTGKALAKTMYTTVKQKYAKFQSSRGYRGTIKSRNLHMLREAFPPGVYIELGNIQNPKDQKRFTLVANREAIASWFAEALENE